MSNTRVYFIIFVFSILVTIRVVHLMENSGFGLMDHLNLNRYVLEFLSRSFSLDSNYLLIVSTILMLSYHYGPGQNTYDNG